MEHENEPQKNEKDNTLNLKPKSCNELCKIDDTCITISTELEIKRKGSSKEEKLLYQKMLKHSESIDQKENEV